MATKKVTTTVNGVPHTSTVKTSSSSGGSSGTVPDSQVAANQAAAAKLGISLPGVGGSSAGSLPASQGLAKSQGGIKDAIRAPGDTRYSDIYGEDADAKVAQEAAAGIQQNPAIPGQVQGNITPQTVPGALGAQTPPSASPIAPAAPPSRFEQGLQAAQASGAQAPSDAGQARIAASSYLPPAPPDSSAVDAFISTDPAINSLMKNVTELLNPKNQTTSLLDDYNKMYKQSGLKQINQDIIDAETVINGTEDDIRNEIQGAGGFGTESQVQAMSLARNKSLLVRYNQLVQQKTDATNQLNTLSNLNVKDKEMAQTKLDSQINNMFKIADFKQQANKNIQEAFNNMVAKVGYAGAYAQYSKDPRQLGFIEQMMGLTSGGLKTLAAQPDLDMDAKRAQIEASRASTAASYSTIAKNSAETQQVTAAKAAANKASAQTADTVLGSVSKALGQVSKYSSGTLGGYTTLIPGTPAKNLESTIKTIQANLALSALAELKANSPNGASGLGAASDREGDWLSSAVANLDVGQSPAQLKENLNAVQTHYVSYLATLGYGYDAATGSVITP